MFRPYLVYVEMVEMISRRLTKTQKAEIVEAYRAGGNTNVLAGKFSCTANTINRTVKTLLSDSEYKLLKAERSKINNKKVKLVDDKTLNKKNEDFEQSSSLISSKDKIKKGDLGIKVNEEFHTPNVDNISAIDLDHPEDSFVKNQNNNNNSQNEFEAIPPLVSDFDFDIERHKSDFEILNYESLPESVFMIVDKKVELDFQTISDLPEWNFLPENELKRNALLLFANQRSAKRSCSKNQRVIKIPNTSIFKLSKSYLISKGITRLILEDSIIALDQ